MDLGGLSINVLYAKGKHPKIEIVDFISRAPGLPDCSAPGCKICEVADFTILKTPVQMNKSIGSIAKKIDKTRFFASQRTEPLFGPEEYVDDRDFGFQNNTKLTNTFNMNAFSMTMRRNKTTLPQALGDKALLSKLQMEDKVLRSTLKHLEGGLNATPRKDPKVRTLIDIKGAFLDNEYLLITYYKNVGEERYKVYPMPISAAPTLFDAVHKSHGHMSPTMLAKAVSRHFVFENVKRLAEKYVNECIDCTRQRKESGNLGPMKEVPIPKKVGYEILVDEIHRTTRDGSTAKFLFASESITKFGVLIFFKGGLTSEKFVKMMKLVKDSLSPGISDTNLTVRLDGAKGHSAGNTSEQLALENIKIHIFQPTSRSPNKIPEIDARIGKLSRHLNLFMSTDNDAEEAARKAIRAYNNTVGDPALGYSPVELWLRRTNVTMSPIIANDEYIIEKIRDIRAKNRAYKERGQLASKLKPLKIPEPLTADEIPAIEPGDSIKLLGPFEKNELRPIYVVEEVCWEFRYVMARRANLKRKGKLSKFRFTAIARIVKKSKPHVTEVRVLERDLERGGRQNFVKATAGFFHEEPIHSHDRNLRLHNSNEFPELSCLISPTSMTSSQLQNTPRAQPLSEIYSPPKHCLTPPSSGPVSPNSWTREETLRLRESIRSNIPSNKVLEQKTAELAKLRRRNQGIPAHKYSDTEENIRHKANTAALKARKQEQLSIKRREERESNRFSRSDRFFPNDEYDND